MAIVSHYSIDRLFFALIICMGISFVGLTKDSSAQPIEVTEEMILNDKDAPVGGNANGDLTIVMYSDYNCPFCKKISPILAKVVKEDGNIRLVYKDWPVISKTSRDGARLALAAKYQNKYEIAHHALMETPGHDIPVKTMRDSLQKAGINMSQLDQDLKAHKNDIDSLIARNEAQGDALGLQATPTFLIGPFMANTLDEQGFKQIISDAREEEKQ